MDSLYIQHKRPPQNINDVGEKSCGAAMYTAYMYDHPTEEVNFRNRLPESRVPFEPSSPSPTFDLPPIRVHKIYDKTARGFLGCSLLDRLWLEGGDNLGSPVWNMAFQMCGGRAALKV